MTSRSTLQILLFSVALTGTSAPILCAQQTAGKSRADELLAVAKHEALTHTFRTAESDTPLLFRSEPVLKWSNPIVGETYGAVFIWTSKGRPEVVWCLHRGYEATRREPHEAVEYLSLSTSRVTGDKDGQPLWTPSRAGIEPKPVPGAPVPAEVPAQRRRQMLELAKDFTGRQTDRKGVERDMRLLTQPIYRYEGALPPVIDGALFSFVQGTDPEVLLLIEARRVGEQTEWQYSLSRMTSIELKVSHRGKVVWTVPVQSWDEVQNRREPYMSFITR
jgi:hypothetical protein